MCQDLTFSSSNCLYIFKQNKMNRLTILIFIIIIDFTVIGQVSEIKHVDVSEFKKLITSTNGSLIDVRTQQEFANGHIKNAGQLNYYAIDFNKKLLMLQKNKPVYLYCNTGYRSKKAANTLVKNGYTQVYNLEKGIMNWNIENYEIVVEKDAKPFLIDKIESDEYHAFLNNNKNVLIDFYAPWCAPCQKIMPTVDSLKISHKNNMQILKINVDASKKLVRELKIIGVPYFAFYKSGKLIKAHQGSLNENELELLVNTIYN